MNKIISDSKKCYGGVKQGHVTVGGLVILDE